MDSKEIINIIERSLNDLQEFLKTNQTTLDANQKRRLLNNVIANTTLEIVCQICIEQKDAIFQEVAIATNDDEAIRAVLATKLIISKS